MNSLFTLLPLILGFLPLFSVLAYRFLPKREDEDLIGCGAEVTSDSGPVAIGTARVKKCGKTYEVSCRSTEPLASGSDVIVKDYDETLKVYLVSPSPWVGSKSIRPAAL